MGSGLVLIALSLSSWATGNRDLLAILTWLVAAPLVAAAGVALAHWPTQRHAALAADRRLGLGERLATAAEIVRRRERTGRFDQLQVRDAIGHADARPSTWLALDAGSRNEGALAVGVLLLGAASLLLPILPGPGFGQPDHSAVSLDAAAAPDLALRVLPEDAPDLPLANIQAAQQPQSNADLAARVQQEQAERSALDSLARALSSVSPGQAAADAIQKGNFTTAHDQLQQLGEEADQLSDAAKRQLAAALQQAAAATAQTDRQLATRERQAAQALSRSAYSEQRQALRDLADQVERSGARSVPADQLERDMGRLQQQQGGGAQSAAGSPSGTSGGNGEGQPGGPGVGTGSDPNVFGDPSRLDTAGQTVQIPTRLGVGPGVRPSDGFEDQTAGDLAIGARSVSELSQAQQTGQVIPEQNLVPGEQRPVVRGYFR